MTSLSTATPVSKARPPGPKGRWLLGSVADFSASPHKFCVHMATYGDVTMARLGPLNNYFLFHPDDMAEVLIRQAKHTTKDPMTRSLNEILGDGLLTNEGEPWRRQRKLIAPVMGKKQVDAYAGSIVRHAESYVERVKGQERELANDMMTLTLSIISEVIFGVSVDSEVQNIGREVEFFLHYFNHYGQGWKRLLPRWLPTPMRRRLWAVRKSFDTRLARIIAERKSNITDDLISRLLLAQDDELAPMSPKLVRDESITMMLAGHETTAQTLTYALYLLCKNPATLARATEEARKVLGKRRAAAADFAALPYILGVAKEAMRLYPPAWGFGRMATEDLTLRNTVIPKGSGITMSPYVVHRDARWYEAPLEFRPERWIGDLESRLPRCAYVPFGDGPRVCVGNHFAMLEIVLVLATFLQRTEVSLLGNPELEVVSTITLRPAAPLPFRLKAG